MLISLCRLTLTFCRLTATLFHFFTALCSLRFYVHCVLFVMLSDYAYRRFNHVAVAVYMIVLMSVLLCLCRMTVIFDIAFFFNFLRYFSHLTTVLRFLWQCFVCYARVSLLFWTVVFVERAKGSRPLTLCLYLLCDICLNELSFLMSSYIYFSSTFF